MTDEVILSVSARAEAQRLICFSRDDVPMERYTCFDCHGARLRSEVPSEQLIPWGDLIRFNRETRTLCALAWDGYNTNGDCLASK